MKHAWVLDVLADLKCYAGQNGLTVLGQHLDACQLAAAIEMANGEPSAEAVVPGNASGSGRDRRGTAERDCA